MKKYQFLFRIIFFPGIDPVNYEARLKESWVWKELKSVRNIKPG
jgi:flavin-dependent dehydrogenase